MGDPIPVHDAKAELRRAMRALRRSLPDADVRSERLWRFVEELPAMRSAAVVMAFESIPGEPDTGAFLARLRARGVDVLLPEDDPAPDPLAPDVVIVPGVAFTPDGRRLGQGGGWYDRFLPLVGESCRTVGVGFAPQLIAEVPTEPHDVALDAIVTDAGIASPT